MRLNGTSPAGPAQVSAMPARMLVLATAGFTISFWAWTLLAPLGSALAAELGLSSFQQSLVVAVPVIVGSLGRIPVGALTDRVGARRMFPAVSALTILPVLYLGHLADSFAGFLAGGFFLGLGGTTFAIGVPFVNAWYPPQRRGLALGVFGVGTGGTAIAAFTTVQLADAVSRSFPFDLAAAALAVYAVAAVFLLRDPAERAAPQGSLVSRTLAIMRMAVTWQLAFLYAVAFGGFVAFNVYLPTYLADAHGLGQADAAMRTAVFVLLAVAARPFGGWLSDRLGAVPVLLCVFAVVAVLAAVCAAEPALIPLGTIAFLGLAAALGAGAGAVFALVARLVDPGKVGSVTGVVGAAGGLGGFFPPLVMGLVKGITGEFTWGFVLLGLTAVVAGAFTATAVRRRAHTAAPAPT